MERTYESAAALVGRAAGPLAGHLGAFVGSLIDRQFRASVIYVKAQHALAFDGWLAKRGAVLADLSDVHIELYQHRRRRRHERILAETRRRERNHIGQLLQFLRDRGPVRRPGSRSQRLTILRPAMNGIFRLSRGWRPERSNATERSPDAFSTNVSAAAPSICAHCAPAT